MIEVFDNFFSEEIHNEIFDLLTRPMWSFTGGQDTSPFWHMEALDQEEYFRDFLYGVIKEKLGIDYETEESMQMGKLLVNLDLLI